MDLEAFADAAQTVGELDALEVITHDALQGSGFNAFMFASRSRDGAAELFGRCNRPYLKRYRTERLNVVDPVAREVRASWLPVTWDCVDYLSAGREGWAELFESSAEIGYERGISAPVNGPLGQQHILTAIYSGSRVGLRTSCRSLGHELMVLGAYLACAYDRLTTRSEDGHLALSDRQLECLAWSAKGKTAWEVSRIIGVTERTVNFHLQTAMSKLEATSKHHAWLKAVRLGLISV